MKPTSPSWGSGGHHLELGLDCSKTPMPRLIRIAILIIGRKGKYETVSLCPRGKPSERLSSIKLGLKRRTTWGANINGAARVVFTVAGGRAYAKYLFKR